MRTRAAKSEMVRAKRPRRLRASRPVIDVSMALWSVW